MTPAVAAIVVVAVVIVAAMIVTAVGVAITMTFLVLRNVLAVIPVVLHKVDPLATGVV